MATKPNTKDDIHQEQQYAGKWSKDICLSSIGAGILCGELFNTVATDTLVPCVFKTYDIGNNRDRHVILEPGFQ